MSLAIDRHLRFFQNEETDRPLVTFWLGTYFPLEQFPSMASSLPSERINPQDINVSALLQDYDRLFQMYAEVDDDTIFVAALPVLPWLEAILGCTVTAMGATFWAEPFLDDWNLLKTLERPNDNGWLDKLLELTEALVDHADGAYPVALPLLRGTSDLMSASRGHTQFPIDLYDYPAEIKQLEAICRDLWLNVATQLSTLIPPFAGGYCTPAYSLWAPGQIIQMQQDATTLMSPRFYRDMISQGDRQISERFEFSILHLHPPSKYLIDDVLELPQLDAVELNFERAGPDLDNMISIWRRMQSQKPLLIWAEFEEEELSRVVSELNPRGLALNLVVSNPEHAKKQMAVVEQTARKNWG